MFRKSWFSSLFRKKTFQENVLSTDLKRCLSVVDVTCLALGQMIGAGIYVLTGSVVREKAGPSVILSFLFAGIAALLSAFSYAEFGARYPRAGSAYTYTYVGVGEVWAFAIGWTVILEYMIGTAAVARSWSGYFDSLIDNRIKKWTMENVGVLGEENGFFSNHFDFLAFALICLSAIVIANGAKSSATFNTVFVFLNISILAFVICSGAYYADFNLWIGTTETGESKFFPFGIEGTLAGAATCFFSFIGFECLATAGEEAKNPKKTIPIATFLSLGSVTIIYILMGAALTLMVPYDQVNSTAGFADAFQAHGATVARYVVTFGALAGMTNNLITSIFALPRAVYAMAADGLIFEFFAKINSRFKIPLNAVIVFTIINALFAAIFDLETLIEFLSIGTLMAYSFVSGCIILLRYQTHENNNSNKLKNWFPLAKSIESVTNGSSALYCLLMIVAGFFWLALSVRLAGLTNVVGFVNGGMGVLLSGLGFIGLLFHEQNDDDMSFKVPLVPLIPVVSLLINIFMITFLDPLTWVRLFVWMAIGFLIYFGYGYFHSSEGKKQRANKSFSTICSETIKM
ncbi:unnamed protein product [Auanema sp. JU1783]|nr:unnamed protein product [Auanema sp. JU1783]